MSNKGVCRTAPATPGLLITGNEFILLKLIQGQGDCQLKLFVLSQTFPNHCSVSDHVRGFLHCLAKLMSIGRIGQLGLYVQPGVSIFLCSIYWICHFRNLWTIKSAAQIYNGSRQFAASLCSFKQFSRENWQLHNHFYSWKLDPALPCHVQYLGQGAIEKCLVLAKGQCCLSA